MKPTVAKLPHGWCKGYMKQTDVIDTIESSIGRWDIVIVEPNGTIEREREIPIKNRTKKGYLMASDGDGIDLGLHRKNHRGTVKHGVSHTIKTEIDCGVIEIE